jgi:acetylornithine deacetylase
MKSFIACSLAALEFAEVDVLERPGHLAFSYDEEVGCLGAPPLIEKIHSSIKLPAVAIVGEPSTMRIIGSHKGVHIYKVQVTGRPSHSSATHLGVSANAIAIRLMSVLLTHRRRADGGWQTQSRFPAAVFDADHWVDERRHGSQHFGGRGQLRLRFAILPEHDAEEILRPFHAEIDLVRRAHSAATISVESLAAVPPLVRVLDCKAEAVVRMIGRDESDVDGGLFGAEAGQFQQSGLATVDLRPRVHRSDASAR